MDESQFNTADTNCLRLLATLHFGALPVSTVSLLIAILTSMKIDPGKNGVAKNYFENGTSNFTQYFELIFFVTSSRQIVGKSRSRVEGKESWVRSEKSRRTLKFKLWVIFFERSRKIETHTLDAFPLPMSTPPTLARAKITDPNRSYPS